MDSQAGHAGQPRRDPRDRPRSAHVAVYAGANATASIANYGSIAGSILTGTSRRQPVQPRRCHAGAAQRLIDLGAYSSQGNSFTNEGLIVVRGDGNLVDMGQGLYTLVPRSTRSPSSTTASSTSTTAPPTTCSKWSATSPATERSTWMRMA
jgi:hypothetical protein